MRNTILLTLLFNLNLIAQDFYSLDYFPVWDMPSTQFNGVGQDLIGPSIYQPTSSDEIYNIHLEYNFYVKRI